MNKKLVAVLILALLIVFYVGIVQTDWFQRNYAYFGDHIHIYVYQDGVILPTGDYEIDLMEEWYYEKKGRLFTENKWGYSIKGDYGTLRLTLKYQGREAEFFLENVNDWWRTNINLYIDTYSDTVRQTNIVWNNDPAFADSFTLQWEEDTD